MASKKRLDQLIQERYPDMSRTLIQSFITQGKVTVNGQPVSKSGTQVAQDAEITITTEQPKYVSRAGFKLEKALDHFNIDVTGLIALDAGLSTGGFADCLLQRGIKRIYGIDVGYGQVHEKIRKDDRVVVMERTNLRNVTQLPELVDLVTLDLSFISVLKVMEAITHLMKEHAKMIVLIKPQFEAERGQVGKGGIIKNVEIHKQVTENVIKGIETYGFTCKGLIESPIEGAMGNKEFLAYFVR